MDPLLPESVYFPALDKCLNGEALLISWKTAFVGLSSPSPVVPEDSSLERFLSDPSSTSALSRPFSAFPSPTQQSGLAFNTRTAAINVAPVTSGKYDISQIREDALWLSKESKINEVGALRVVLLEWQTRPAAQLLGGFSEEEVASIQDATGGSALGSSIFLPNSSILSVPSDQQKGSAAFNSLENRRLRQLKLYLSERRYILKVGESLIRAGLSDPGAAASPRSGMKGKEKEDTNRVGRIGRTILNARILGGEVGRSGKPFLIECIEAMQERITALENGSGWFKEEDGRLEAEADWGKNQVLEMIHIMQIMFLLLDAQSDITISSVALAWLRLMSKYAFFDRFEPADISSQLKPYPSLHPFIQPLQSLASLVSLLILKLPLVLDHLLGETEQPMLVFNGSPESAPYIVSPSAISEIQAMLTGAAGSCLVNASPAVFAWSIILQTMREVVRTRREARELRQSQRAAHNYSEAESTETEAGESSVTEPGSGGTSPRPYSIGSDISSEPGMYDEVLEDIIKSTLDEDPIGYLAKSAVNGSHVFEVIQNLATEFCVPLSADLNGEDGLRMRNILLHLVRASLEWVEYLPEVVLAALSLLQGEDRYWEFADAPPIPPALNPAHLFLNNQLLCEKLLNAAIYRFPYEPIPFLRLFKALCLSWSSEPVDDDGALLIISKLENIPTFTQTLPPSFASYELAHEEDGRNMVQLTKSLSLFGWKDGQQALLTQANRNQDTSMLANGANGSHIPVGTLGIILFESRPMVAIWYHKYSALKYIGKTLESALADSGVVEYAAGTGLDKDIIGDMVGLIAMLLTASTKAAEVRNDVVSAPEAAQRILEDASDGVGRNRDVIAIIFDLFEEELQEQQLHPGVDRSMHLLVNCLHFIYALIPVLPGRVWAFLARSGLLQIDGRGGKLTAVVAGTEIISGRYEALTSCIRIFGALVEDAVTHAIARKGSSSRVVARFNSPTAMATGVSEKVMKDILLAFARTVVDFFESSPGWKFVVLSERLEIGTQVASIMDKIMCYSYSVDDSPELDSKVTHVLAPAARFISEVFLSTSPNDNVIRPILRIFYEGIGTPNSTLFLRTLHSWTAQVQAILKFSTTLIHVGRLLRLPTSHLEKQFFKASPLLSRLYVAHEAYRLPVVALFESLVASAAASEQEPPSLLGHLGPETAKNFLSVLSNLDKPIDDDELDIQIWNLLSAVVSNRQQWLAIYLLTGNTPRGSLTRKESNPTSGAPRGEPLLAVALDSLADIDSLPPRRALAMLEFVALAEDYWPWAMADMHRHPKFVTAISDFVGKLDTQMPTVENANKIRMASFIAEIIAMYLHHLRQLGDDSFVKTLMPKLKYYMSGAVSAPCYNLSLHSNLRKNFEMKFPNTTLLNFKRTQLQRRYFGIDYFYDLDLATKLLRFEPSWTGIRREGFSYDVVQANINLSVVEAQVLTFVFKFLLHSWKLLAIELSSALANDPQLHKAMARVVVDCLAANASADLPEAIFARLTHVRADFAFVLMQRLAEVHSTEPEVRAVLDAVWKTIRTSNTDFQLALSSGNATYYRSLLKILFLALRAHVEHGTATTAQASKQRQPGDSNEQPAQTGSEKPKISASTTQLILEILELIVTRGFHELAAAVHERPADSSPEDIVLVTAILQTSLRIPGIEAIHPQLCQQVAIQGTARVATTLFSWSDRLAIDGDPVYGELSILFLLELSSVPLIAEQLATEGVLAQLANANLMAFIRRGISPFDSPPRLHAIWARGILSLLLNLLEALGPSIATEVALFLNQFPNQLDAAVANWDNNNTNTTATEPPKPPSLATATTSSTSSAASPKKSPTTTHHGISLSMATEAHSLALLSHILTTFSTNNPSAVGVIPPLKLKRAQLAEGLEVFLSHRRILAAKIVPMTPGDVELAGTPGVGGMGSLLEARVVREMVEARALLSGGDGEG
ncbi:hypothetical protein GP486_004694 [Trichoglossum hirsutum]|uniref:Nucleoporin NUP188 n=1 Tax=Trichoglossum hirsutum TaxID=265104 RepID=A0A9P8RNM6_9PEZI|nr:hypothetical protein GP486_004694 [Trichoglossum hirsutum]